MNSLLEVLEALPGPVCPIAFVGDGRSGKSFLASKLAARRSIIDLEPFSTHLDPALCRV